MVRLLRWGTFIVVILVITGAALNYPLLRARFFAPVATMPGLAVAEAAGLQAASDTPTPRATLPNVTARPTRPAVVIAAPSLTPALSPVPNNTAPAAGSSVQVAVATTSLLPDTVTPIVLDPSTTETETPTLATGSTRAEWGGRARELADTSVLSGGATAAATSAAIATVPRVQATSTTTTATVPATSTTPVEVTPIVVVPVVVGDATMTAPDTIFSTPVIAPVVVTTITVPNEVATPLPTLTPQPLGPTTNVASALYSRPDLASPTVGQVAAGEQITIVGLYTEGNWYLLANGLWIPGDAVDNAPLAMPLVFPTMTPAPSPTPTPTFTPLPTATLVGTETPTPTATSLDEQVCDCTGDSLDCLGNIFANRAEAQRCFEYCFRKVGRDIHLLDPNLNGMACENLP